MVPRRNLTPGCCLTGPIIWIPGRVYLGLKIKQSLNGRLITLSRYGFEMSSKPQKRTLADRESEDIQLPEGWVKIVDRANKVSFLRHEKWSFKNQRVTTELSMQMKDSNELSYTISSHGCQIDIGKDLNTVNLQDCPLQEQVS